MWGFLFMKIVIRTKDIELTKDLKNFIEEKINSLEKFSKIFYNEKYYNHFFGKGKPKIEAFVEVGKETKHHQKGPFFKAECQMRLPGKGLRAEALSENLKFAVNEIKEELERELKEYKEKIVAKKERKSRIIKKELKISPLARLYRKGRIREEGI